MTKFIIAITLMLTASLSSACDFADKRVCKEYAALMDAVGNPKHISIKFSANQPEETGEVHHYKPSGDKLIIIGDTRTLSNSGVKFLLAHEFGHAMLGLCGDNHQDEFNADEYAANWFGKTGGDALEGIRQVVGPNAHEVGRTHPKGTVRIRKVTQIVNSQSK